MFYGTYKLMMDRYPSVSSRKKLDTGNHVSVDIAGRRRARRALLAKSDHLLADMGFSRELLEQGVKAWPWLVTPETTGEFAATASVVALTAHHSDVAEVRHHVMEEQRYAA